MRPLWSRSLAAQIICFMLLALAISQGIGFLISWDERGQALRAAAKGEFFSRTASLARLIEGTPSSIHDGILRASDTSYTRFWLSTEEPRSALEWRQEARAQLAKPLPSLTKPHHDAPAPDKRELEELSEATAGITAAVAAPTSWVELPPAAWPLSRPAKFVYLDDSNGMGLAVRLDSGAWLNAAFAKSLHNSIWTSQSAISLAITAAVLSLIAIGVARSIARPMRRLAGAAEALGRGETVAPLPESGPDDIRQTAEAFNRMQERLQRFVEDRTRMLAAIGHDLRTPLTTLRLRTEFVSDPDIQDKMLKTIAEMETMTEATLAFAREDATAESTRTVNLCALVESLCDDLAELGRDVTFIEGPTINYRCRPDALRRAIRNLVENAVRYGERARVRLVRTADTIDIVVEDDGPGIPNMAMEQVFAPFYRLEHSRNQETGGFGLGLSIARAIARHHGGDILLTNTHPGLRAIVSLPSFDQA
jgi:signal transduction histidine kinase